jgi:hypothetical protein
VDSLVNAHGLVAWTLHAWSDTGLPATFSQGLLEAHDAAGIQLLDTTEPLALGRLRFTGDTLQWTENNLPKSKPLSHR